MGSERWPGGFWLHSPHLPRQRCVAGKTRKTRFLETPTGPGTLSPLQAKERGLELRGQLCPGETRPTRLGGPWGWAMPPPAWPAAGLQVGRLWGRSAANKTLLAVF